MIVISILLVAAILTAGMPQTKAGTASSIGSFPQNTSSMSLSEIEPLGPKGQPLQAVETIFMPTVDVEKYLAEDLQSSIGQPYRFAIPILQEIDPNSYGTWESLPGGLLLWRLRIVSSGAKSLNLGFEKYHLPQGGHLFIYNPDLSEVLGPYTEQDNTSYAQLWTPIIESDEIIVELSIPSTAASEFSILLTSINHGYKEFHQVDKSGSCNVDVVCPQGDAWRDEIRSVGMYIYSGSYRCTGALINNTAQNFKPYFLTANHCVSTSSQAASMVVYWNYENPTCRTIGSAANATPISLSGFPYQSGAYLRATHSVTDFTLVELSSPVATSINAFWSGWNRTSANATSSVTIHHPRGHEKRISFDNDPTTITSYIGYSVPGDGSHFRIGSWDLGTTEQGSSGAPLFNQNRQIIGQLHGGYAACGNNESDWYGRLNRSWTGGGTNSTRLSNWLDPINTGVSSLNGLDSTRFPPPPPTGVSASDGEFTDKIRVSWGGTGQQDYKIFLPLIFRGSGPTFEAPYFQVYRNTTNSSAGATKLVDHHPASPYDDTSAAVGTTFYYWVKACNSAGCSDFSASDSGYRVSEITAPSPPTGVSASDGTYTDKVQVAWAASGGATYYQVFRHTSNSSSSATPLTEDHPSSPFNDTSAAVGTTYYYWVKACNSGGCSGFSESDTGYRASEITAPSPPTGVSASDGTYTDKVQVAWAASGGAAYYQVFRHTSNSSSSATPLTEDHPSSPYNDTSGDPGTTYYYWVKACNSAGCSGFSESDSGYRQETSGGFNSQFDGHADGWVIHSGTWYLSSNNVLWTEGIEGTSSSVSYVEDFDNFDYQVKMGRLGSDTNANQIMVRGTPSPLQTGNRWYSGYVFQYSRNGSFSIFKSMPNGEWAFLQDWTSSSAIYQGDYYNILRVVANGSDFSFYINGTLVWQGSDTSFSSGRVGIGMYRAASTGLTEQLVVDWAVLTTLGAGDAGSSDPILQEPERIINEMIIDGDENQIILP